MSIGAVSDKSVREELEELATSIGLQAVATRDDDLLDPRGMRSLLIVWRDGLRSLASRLPAAEAPDAPPPDSLLETAGNSLRWLLHLHHGVSLGGEDTPITDAEWKAALGSAQSALAAIENYKPPPAPDEGACARSLRDLVRHLDAQWEYGGHSLWRPELDRIVARALVALRTAPEEREGNLHDARRVVFKEVHDKVVELERRSGGFDLEHFCDWLAEQDGTYARETAPPAPSPTLAPDLEEVAGELSASADYLRRLQRAKDLRPGLEAEAPWYEELAARIRAHRCTPAATTPEPDAPAPGRAAVREVVWEVVWEMRREAQAWGSLALGAFTPQNKLLPLIYEWANKLEQSLGGERDRSRRMQRIRGLCPACRNSTLFLADGDFVTCSWAQCPDPSAASRQLKALDPLPPSDPDRYVRASEDPAPEVR